MTTPPPAGRSGATAAGASAKAGPRTSPSAWKRRPISSCCRPAAWSPWPGPQALLVEDPEQGRVIEYEKLILCTGARELLLPFPGWTLPGVTGAGGLQALIKGGVPVAGERIVIAGSGPLLLASAATARDNGARCCTSSNRPAGPPWPASPRSCRAGRTSCCNRSACSMIRLPGQQPCGRRRSATGAWKRAPEHRRAAARNRLRAPGLRLRPGAQPAAGQALGCRIDNSADRRRRLAGHQPGRRLRGRRDAPASAAARRAWWKAPSPVTRRSASRSGAAPVVAAPALAMASPAR